MFASVDASLHLPSAYTTTYHRSHHSYHHHIRQSHHLSADELHKNIHITRDPDQALRCFGPQSNQWLINKNNSPTFPHSLIPTTKQLQHLQTTTMERQLLPRPRRPKHPRNASSMASSSLYLRTNEPSASCKARMQNLV